MCKASPDAGGHRVKTHGLVLDGTEEDLAHMRREPATTCRNPVKGYDFSKELWHVVDGVKAPSTGREVFEHLCLNQDTGRTGMLLVALQEATCEHYLVFQKQLEWVKKKRAACQKAYRTAGHNFVNGSWDFVERTRDIFYPGSPIGLADTVIHTKFPRGS